MIFRSGRYSGFIRPISYLIDLSIIHVLAYKFFAQDFLYLNYIIFVSIAWVILSLRSNFYEIYRFTHVARILSLLGKQGVVFFLIVFAFFGLYNQLKIDPIDIIWYVLLVILIISFIKFTIYFLLKSIVAFLGKQKESYHYWS